MTLTHEFIRRLENLQEGERSKLRCLAGRPLDAKISGFDLFTGLWWPLRAKSELVPRREPSWLVAKLFSAIPIPHVQSASGKGLILPEALGCCEPRNDLKGNRFRNRFDALLCTSLPSLEPYLRWALAEVAEAVSGHVPQADNIHGIDWVRLLDDLSIWDRGEEHRNKTDVRNIWAEMYLNGIKSNKRRA